MEAKRLVLDAGMTEPVLRWQAQSQPIPQHLVRPSALGPHDCPSESPAEARMRSAQAGVVAQGAELDLVTCLRGCPGHVTWARVS